MPAVLAAFQLAIAPGPLLLNEISRLLMDGLPGCQRFLDQGEPSLAGATTGPIPQRLKELESQIALAGEQQNVLLRQLKAAVQDKQFYAARNLLVQASRLFQRAATSQRRRASKSKPLSAKSNPSWRRLAVRRQPTPGEAGPDLLRCGANLSRPRGQRCAG